MSLSRSSPHDSNKPGGIVISETKLKNESNLHPRISSPLTTKSQDEVITSCMEPLFNGPFHMELAWELCKEKFGGDESPTPMFLSFIDRLQEQGVLIYEEGSNTMHFADSKPSTASHSGNIAWLKYFKYWARQAADISQQIRTNKFSNGLDRYRKFKHHFTSLFLHIVSLEIIDDHAKEIGSLVGGKVGDLLASVYTPGEGCDIARSIVVLCAPDDLTDTMHNSVGLPLVPVPIFSHVGARTDLAMLLRYNTRLQEASDLLYSCVVHARILPRDANSSLLEMECLLQLALCQHDQIDRVTGGTMESAMRENVKYLYQEVLLLCQNFPRGQQPDPAMLYIKGRAQTGMACLLASNEEYEHSALMFDRAKNTKLRFLSMSHPSVAETLLGQGNLEKDQGSLQSALEHFEQAFEVFTAAYGPTHIYVARCVNSLAVLYDDSDKFDEAIDAYLHAKESYSTLLGETSIVVADVLMNLGGLLNSLEKHDDAFVCYKEAWKIYSEKLGKDHPDTTAVVQSMEETQRALGKKPYVDEFTEADESSETDTKNLEKSIGFVNTSQDENSLKKTGSDNDDTSLSTNDVAVGMGNGGQFFSKETKRLFPEGVEFLLVQAEIMYGNEFFSESRAAYEECLLLCRQQERKEIETTKMKERAASAAAQLGREKTFESMQGNDNGADGDESEEEGDEGRYVVTTATLYIATVLCGLGDLLDDMRLRDRVENEYDEEVESDITEGMVVKLYEEALAIYRIALGEEDLKVADTLSKLGSHFCLEGEFGHAESLYDEALVIYRLRWRSENHRDVAEAKYLLARAVHGQGNFEEANEICAESLRIYRVLHGTETKHMDIAHALNNQGGLFQEQDEFEKAKECYTEALMMYREIFQTDGEAHPFLARACNNLGSLYDDMEKFSEAKQYYEEALSILSEVYHDGHPQIAITLCNLASMFSSQGLKDEARPLYEVALSIYRKTYGDDHVTVKDTMKLIERMDAPPSSCILL